MEPTETRRPTYERTRAAVRGRGFDGIFSSSSIEHFGDLPSVRRAVEEISRVLKSGGILTLSTEFRLQGPGPGLDGTLVVGATELHDVVLKDLAWSPVWPIAVDVSRATLESEQSVDEAVASPDGGRIPHIVLRSGPLLWTASISLCGSTA